MVSKRTEVSSAIDSGGVSVAPCHDACAVSGYNPDTVTTASYRLSSGALSTGVDPNTGFLAAPSDAPQVLSPTPGVAQAA